MNKIKLIIPIVFNLVITSCYAQLSYRQEIQKWKKDRLTELKAENGWLNLAGLFWLKEGRQSFGGTISDSIRFPIPSFPAEVGYLEKQGNQVKQVLQKNLSIKVNGLFKQEAIIYSETYTNHPNTPNTDFRWTLIKREDIIGIRFRNLSAPAIVALTEIPCFDIDTMYRVKAKLARPMIPQSIPIENVLGQVSMQFSPGKLSFTINGKKYVLDALAEGDKLFVLFGDATSGKTSYPAGRFLYADFPGEDGITILDFNKSFNPPCAFTLFATCPLPPPQNILPIGISAGERMPAKN